MKRIFPLLATLLLLAARPAAADIVLPGSQHLGDKSNAGLTPTDPVKRAEMQGNPTRFFLSQTTIITAGRVENAVGLNKLRFYIDNMATPLAGTQSGSTFTLTVPLTLTAGSHSVWPDGGCKNGTFTLPCVGGEQDFGFTDITLVSAQTTTSLGDHRRRHLGDTKDAKNDFYGGKYYPDNPDGSAVNIGFTLDISRVISELRFWRLRNVPAAPLSFPRVLIDGVLVGNLTGNGSPFILSSGVAYAAGAHTLRIESGSQTAGNLNDFSWDDIVMVLTNNPASTVGKYNAVDTGADPSIGHLQTKTAGSSFAVDLVALQLPGGTLATAYTGAVTVDLLDSSVTNGAMIAGTNCDTGWASLGTLGGAVFTLLDAGRHSFTTSYAGAVADARLRITDGLVTSCSADNFAIKPAGFGNIQASDTNRTTAGTTRVLPSSGFTPSTTPRHSAGRPFTVQATAINALGATTPTYAGSPTLSAVSSLLGNNVGVASSGAWSASLGTVRTDNALYSEAGAVRLQLIDTTFAAVDANDTPSANRQIGPTTFDAGRFVPDHFRFDDVTAGGAQFATACGTFTYLGQPFTFQVTPSATITAVGGDGTTTTNYDDTLYKLPAGPLPQAAYTAFAGTFDNSIIPNPDNSFVNQGNGVSLYTLIPPAGPPAGYKFTRTVPGTPATSPFDADISIALTVSDSDTVALDTTTPGFGAAGAGAGIPFTAGKEVRFGRMVMDNAHGSDKVNLPVPLRTEYWQSSSGGFVQNRDDSCTLAPTVTTSPATAMTGPTAWSLGASLLTLTAPGAPGTVNLTATITASAPWLQPDDNDADLLYNNDPTAVATFGVFENVDERRVYEREVIGP